MTDASAPRGVTVATVLRDLARVRARSISSCSPGATASTAASRSRTPQKTGLALSGFDAYLRGGRVLVFGESESATSRR